MPEKQTADYGTQLSEVLGKVQMPDKEGYTGKWTIDGQDIAEGYKVTEDLTVTAVYTINTYTVTFECDDETLTMPEKQTAVYGTQLSEVLGKVQMPDKEGYTGKWTIGGEDIPDGSVITDDVTITIVYTINTYTVTFECDDETLTMPEKQKADYGTQLSEVLGKVQMPDKEGYTGKWTIGGEDIPDGSVVTNDVTITIVYTINTYTVTYVCEGADEQTPPADTVDYNTKITLPDVPNKTGYTGEWQLEDGTVVTGTYTVTEDVTITAVYTINTYTVTYVCEGADEQTPPADTVDYNTEITLPEVPAKTGHTGEWQLDDGTVVTGTYTVTEDVTITAVYTINEYTVTFTTDEPDITDLPEEQTVKYNETITLPNVPTKTGYTGIWVVDGEEVSGTYTVTDDVTITAVYTINTYTVTYVCEGADEQTPPADTVDYNTEITLPEVPKKTGYTGEWQLDDGTVVSGTYTVTEDVTITIVYTINTYTVTYVCEGADEQTPPADTVDYNTEITLPEVPAKTGHTGEWQLDDGTVVTGTYTVTEDVTITAAYTINKYTVTFESEEDVKLPENLELEYNTVLSDELPEVPDLPGYTGEWQIGGQAVEADYRVTGNVTVTAVYTINKYEVTFTTDEPDITTLPTTEILEHGWGLANYLPAMPEKEGYTGRWTIDGEEIPDGYEVTSDITVKFEYVINTYEITFECDYDDVTMPKTITAEYGTKLSEALADVEIPEKEYYTGKWTIGGADITANDIVEDNVTVTAVYTHIEVKVDIDYVSGYSDSDDNDPANFRLSNSTTDTLDYDMTAEELQSEIATWKESVGSYTAVKVVYDNTETSLSDLDNPLDINNLPEIESGMSLSDIKPYDYTYTDGSYHSILRIYLVPDWTVHKVTFHDVDGSVIQQLNVYNNQFIDIPDVPSSVPDATWVSLRSDDIYHELDLANGVYEDVDAYCGYEVIAHEYYDGGWSEYGFNIYKKIGDTITEEDLENLCFYDVIAGFITEPVSDASEIAGFYSAGQEVNGNIDLYIIKASFDYELADGRKGTIYFFNEDVSLLDELDKLKSSDNYAWRFDNANGDEVNDETLGSRMNYDYDNPPTSPQTAARFTVVEVAS